mmetsp:Transcript_11792/g.31144  ORF Transcript_11792/g.31144 Transcript_11792/m.31144 type:complete len:1117 (+) Transcript_11792:119-3469(+)
MNATANAIMPDGLGVKILSEVGSFLMATRAELFLFCAAVAAYLLLFGNAHPNQKTKASKAKQAEKVKDDFLDDACCGPKAHQTLSPQECEQVEKAFQTGFDAGDHRQVLRCWNAMKKFEQVPNVSLAHAVESMQRFKKDASYILRELHGFLQKFQGQSDVSTINDLLEALGKRLDSDLVDKIVEMMPKVGLATDQRTYEILLAMHFMTRSFDGVRALIAEMGVRKVPFTTRATIVAVKTALKTGNFEEAKSHFRGLKAVWAENAAADSTASTAPRHIVSQLIDLACRDHQLGEFLPLLEGVPVPDDAIAGMLTECIRRKDLALAQRVEQLARSQGDTLSDATYSLLIRSMSSDPARVQAIFDEVVTKGMAPSADFALALLSFCSQNGAIALAERLFEHMQPKQLPVLSGFIRFFTEMELFDKACDVYENHMKHLQHVNAGGKDQVQFLDARIERSLMNAAFRCGRQDLAKNFLDASPSDVAKHIAMIRNCVASNNLAGAMSVFDTLQKSGTELNSVVYNTVLDACVECRDLSAAEAWMKVIKEAGLTDVVTYNTLIKAYLHEECFDKARALMEEMRGVGLQPNRVTFNELVNGLVTKGSAAQRAEIWGIVKEMKAAGVKPNQVTCSILLKSLNAHSSQESILDTMELITAMDEPMDEVLLSSVVEACVRIGKPDLLAEKLKQLQGSESFAVNGSHTFGSLIKAYGHARDINGVWRCWKEMRSRHIRPTSITLGCMVEAVVSNGDTEGAYELIHQMQEDERCRDALNAVIYCSVLKGFTREKKMQRVWAVYDEMTARKVELSIVTYNTLIDACARSGRMDRVPSIFEEMQKQNIKANLITYSTMVKGHCQAGDIQRGFEILEQMRNDAKLKPDEIMYNSLLDGCAQNNLVEEGLGLLARMQSEGVQPSNFTLSLLVKLMNRARKLDNAFNLVDEISTKYKFRPNVHVYTNLIQACIANRHLPRGMATFEQMIKERVQPDNRTYTILVRASLSHGLCDQAAGLVRAALGLRGALPLAGDASVARISNLDPALVGEMLQSLTDKGHVHNLAVPLLSDIKHDKPSYRIDAAVQRHVMSAGMAHETGHQPTYSQQYAAPRQRTNARGGDGRGGAGRWGQGR